LRRSTANVTILEEENKKNKSGLEHICLNRAEFGSFSVSNKCREDTDVCSDFVGDPGWNIVEEQICFIDDTKEGTFPAMCEIHSGFTDDAFSLYHFAENREHSLSSRRTFMVL
jgi:hypothetical protein